MCWFYFSTSEDKEKQYTCQTTRLLALLDALASHKACKLAILHLISGTIKGDERYAEIFQDLLVLVRSPGDSVIRQQCVEYITSILQSLCDQVFIVIFINSLWVYIFKKNFWCNSWLLTKRSHLFHYSCYCLGGVFDQWTNNKMIWCYITFFDLVHHIFVWRGFFIFFMRYCLWIFILCAVLVFGVGYVW